ncbi:GMC family oxidoreductase [Sinorhizobium prairiense]|uniref:GMC family oxidoreductase n=1 Tax=unclassified Sinorhizobium TaxID=2613772 RepID=UPI0023D82D8F|nr:MULTISPECIES: GMC family oxidoreductase [unclassified Sinorhizobium]WEJ08454.1 GMC family oxidoreductase [Sinorhizobium sp. M103]WEJ35642.1 GMC family oxidoreductase [Sinorhizobium sp. C101]
MAARLAEGGFRTLVIEAGDDPRTAGGYSLADEYDVPAFHPFATENPAIAWNFQVKHYSNADEVLYPRASALGGCTAHNAMILVQPHDADWDAIAALTDDDSWAAKNMQRYFRIIEDCRHRPIWRWLSKLGITKTGHGWNGWLKTERALPASALFDSVLRATLFSSAVAAIASSQHPLAALRALLRGRADANDRSMIRQGAEGLFYTPLSTTSHRRIGTRERLLQTAQDHPERLLLETNALAARVLFDADNRAMGVEYLRGSSLYRACPTPNSEPGELRQAHARRGVVLAGGAFNTPQLLMLSGIGPAAHLEAHGIPVRVNLAGVGSNLQDRYEISVVNRIRWPWRALKGALFKRGDPLYEDWLQKRRGMYISNGAAMAVARRSSPDKEWPDLFSMALLADFRGYFPGYSKLVSRRHNVLTWAVLKAHTENRAGTVLLRSRDPRDPPLVEFRYFEEGSGNAAADLEAVVAGIRFARKLSGLLKAVGVIVAEETPGEDLQSDQELADHVRANAWGHHASCSCAIGPRGADGVLDSRLRVHGTHGLYVADASVFPRIPGFFIASAVYMVAEKAAEIIQEDARCEREASR